MSRKHTTENFFRCYPRKALRGLWGLTPEERGIYATLIFLMYDTWRPLEDHDKRDRGELVSRLGCVAQKANPIIARLLEKGRIRHVTIDGRRHLIDERFDIERAGFMSAPGFIDTPDLPPAEVAKKDEKTREVEAKSEEVLEKSGEVRDKSPLLDTEGEQNQQVKALEKNRIEENKNTADTACARADFGPKGTPTPADDWPSAGDVAADLAGRVKGVDQARDAWVFTSVREVHAWRHNGFSYALDVVPAITAIMARDRPPKVRSWVYFTEEIAAAFVARTRGIALPDAKGPTSGQFQNFATRTAAANRAALESLFGEINDG